MAIGNIGQNTEKGPGDLKRLAVTQTSEKDNQLLQVRKIHKELYNDMCNKLKFNNTTKWYVHKQKSSMENVTRKILWDSEIQTDHLTSINKKKKKRKEFVVSCILLFPTNHCVKKKKTKKKRKTNTRETKKCRI